ncbi:MAG TPA: hypothetical protein VMN37_10750 [Gemmatimonadales bacterium]|nr:hypothetical protein [Gemmatimonadales bacterium]
MPRPACSPLTVAAALLLAEVATVQAAAQVADPAPAGRRHQIELLALYVSPTGDPVDEIYGGHPGAAVRYSFQLRPRWSLAGEIGQRQADGSTTAFGFPADLEVLHAAVLANYHWGPGVRQSGRWTAAAGAGVVMQDVEEEVRFPDATVSASDSVNGLLLRAGGRWPLGPAWGLTAEGRVTAMEDAESRGGGEGADFGTFEVAAGAFFSF